MSGRTSVSPLRTALRRARTSWRLLVTATAVATVSCTALTSLGLLVSATEDGGVRGALASTAPERTTIDISVFSLTGPIADARTAASTAVDDLLGSAATSTSTGSAVSEFLPVPSLDADVPAFSYLAEYDAFPEHAELVEGSWAESAAPVDEVLDVAIPQAAAQAFDVGLDDRLPLQKSNGAVGARVVGIYRPLDADEPYWDADPLGGRGEDDKYPKPGTSTYVPVDAFGPLVAAPGDIDAAGLLINTLQLEFQPDFSEVDVGALDSLVDRLPDAENNIYASIGDVAGLVYYTSPLSDTVAGVRAGLSLTRSSVAIAGLLLALVALVALGQTAGLVNGSRTEDRRLMRARGASRLQLLGLDSIEAAGVATVTVVLAAPLASLTYSALAASPAMTAAGMPGTVGLPASAWIIAAALALVFGLVLVGPRLIPDPGELDGPRRRPGRGSGLLRSGLDVALLVLAGIALWQLQQYRSPQSSAGSGAIDPVLTAAPAVALAAGALLALRIVPAVAPLLDAAARRSRGSVWPLAAWEVGRRAQRVSGAVLLITITLAVAVFGQSFLATGTRSLEDQSAAAVGAPVSYPVDSDAEAPSPAAQQAALATGVQSTDLTVSPVLRRPGGLLGPGSDEFSAVTPATVLGLPASARALLATGRNGREGGAAIVATLTDPVPESAGAVLPGDRLDLTAAIRIAGGAYPSVDVDLVALVEDASGVLTPIELGLVPVDGTPHELSAPLPTSTDGTAATAADTAQKLVGIQIYLGPGTDYQPGTSPLPFALGLTGLDYGAEWAGSTVSLTEPPVIETTTDGLRTTFIVPADLTTSSAPFAMTAWEPVARVPVVVSQSMADAMNIGEGTGVTLDVQSTRVGAVVKAVVPLVPGAANPEFLAPPSDFNAPPPTANAVVVDGVLLGRALAQNSVALTSADEWWIDVPAGQSEAYLAAHPVGDDQTAEPLSAELLALDLQNDPLRVAGQVALLLAVIAAALLAAIGFAVHTASSLAARRLELAQLRAIGLSRRRLLGAGVIESLLVIGYGAVAGVGLGALLGWAVAPVITVSPSGRPPVPAVDLVLPGASIALMTAVVVAALLGIGLLLTSSARTADPARILRGNAE